MCSLLDSEEDIEDYISMEETVKSPETWTSRHRGKDMEKDANDIETELITLSDSDREEGEVRDGSFNSEDLNVHVCKFFLKGGCMYGNRCRFLHMPSDKGLYRMLERPTVRQQPTVHVILPPPGFGYVRAVNFQPVRPVNFQPVGAVNFQPVRPVNFQPVGAVNLQPVRPVNFQPVQEANSELVDEELETSWDRALKEAQELFNVWKAPRGEQNRLIIEQTTKATENDVETSRQKPVKKTNVFTCELPPDVGKTSKSDQHFKSDINKLKMTDLNLKSRSVKQSGHQSDHRRSRSKERKSPPNSRGSSSSRCRDLSPPKDRQNSSRRRNRSPSLDHKCRAGPKRRSSDHRRSRSKKRKSPPNSRGSSKTTSSSSLSPPKDRQNSSRRRNRSPSLDHKCRAGRKRRSAARPPSSDTLSWTSDASARKRRSPVRHSSPETSSSSSDTAAGRKGGSSSVRSPDSEDTSGSAGRRLPAVRPPRSPWTSRRNFNVGSIFWARGGRRPNPRTACALKIRKFKKTVCSFYLQGRCAFGDDCHFRHSPQYIETGFDREINLDEEEDIDAFYYETLKEAEKLLGRYGKPPDGEKLFYDLEVPSTKTVKETKRFPFKPSDARKPSWSSRRQFIDDSIRKHKSKTTEDVALKSEKGRGKVSVETKKKIVGKSDVCKARSDRHCVARDNMSKLKMAEYLLSKSRPGRGQSRVTCTKERPSPSNRLRDRSSKNRHRSPSGVSKVEQKRRLSVRLPSWGSLTSDTSAAHRLRSAVRPSRSSSSSSSDSSSSSSSFSIGSRKNRPTSTPKTASTARGYQKHDLKKAKTVRSAIGRRW